MQGLSHKLLIEGGKVLDQDTPATSQLVVGDIRPFQEGIPVPMDEHRVKDVNVSLLMAREGDITELLC